MRFEVVTAVHFKIVVFLDVIPCTKLHGGAFQET
jgi:hypothetical protein